MDTKSQSLKENKFPNWKIHSRAGNFNRRLELEDEQLNAWKSWGDCITVNTKYLEIFVTRDSTYEYDLFYKVWKYPIVNSRVSLDKLNRNSKSKWLIREYLLIPALNRFSINPSLDYSSLWDILSFDETSRLNLFVYQYKCFEKTIPETWTKSIDRARLSFFRRSSKEFRRIDLFWYLLYRRIKRGFIGNKDGTWDTRYNFIKKIS